METIREYLNNLFMSLPETSEVMRAKAELMEMMEDKYEELIQEGKSEKEAVGIVISEFGNLEELAEELGIGVYMKKDSDAAEAQGAGQQNSAGPAKTVYNMGFEEAKGYVEYAWKHAKFIAIGVLLCIWAPYIDSVMDGAQAAGYVPEFLAEMIGTLGLFGMVAVAVGLFCSASSMKKKYGNLGKYYVALDAKAGEFLTQKQAADEKYRLKLRITGVVLCVLSVVPTSMNYVSNPLVSEILDSSVLVIVGVGVLLLVLSCSVGNRYEELSKAVKRAKEQGSNVEYVNANWQEAPKKGMGAGVILGIIAIGFLVVGINVAVGVIQYMNYNSEKIEYQKTEQTFEMGDATSLLVDADAANVRIERSNVTDPADKKLIVKYSGDSRRKPVIKQDGNVVQVQEKSRGKWVSFDFSFFGGTMKGSEITVVVPNSLTGLEYEMDVDAGNLTMANLLGQGAKFDVDAGNLTIEKCTFQDQLKVDVDAGNIKVLQSVIRRLEGEVDAGSISCQLADKTLANYTMDLKVDMGDIKINGEDRGGEYHQTAQTTSGEAGEIKLDVDMGDIKIEAPIQ